MSLQLVIVRFFAQSVAKRDLNFTKKSHIVFSIVDRLALSLSRGGARHNHRHNFISYRAWHSYLAEADLERTCIWRSRCRLSDAGSQTTRESSRQSQHSTAHTLLPLGPLGSHLNILHWVSGLGGTPLNLRLGELDLPAGRPCAPVWVSMLPHVLIKINIKMRSIIIIIYLTLFFIN